MQVDPDVAVNSDQIPLVDVLDALLDSGVVIRGELWLSVADVDLVFLGVDVVLANPDTIWRSQTVQH